MCATATTQTLALERTAGLGAVPWRMNPTLTVAAGFIAWSLFLLVLMEGFRSKLVLSKAVPANGFVPDNSNLSPFMQRLARAHANCLEGLPIFGGLLLVAAVAGRSSITDPLAYTFLCARVVQSLIHLSSLSALAVMLRFPAFSVQMGIGVYWAFRLLAS
jgi:uncharacterized MAPEG superfamily protein